MMTVVIPALVCIAGGFIYALASGKGCELGRIMFAVGLFVTVWHLAGRVVSLP